MSKPQNPYSPIEACELLCHRHKPNLPRPSCIRSGFCEAYNEAKGLQAAWDEGYNACKKQPISEQEGWIDVHDNPPTKSDYYLVDTSDSLEIIPDKWYTCIEDWKTEDMKVGDWFLEDHSYLGTDILKYNSLFEEDDDYKDYFRPWTIADAKNGDVLYSLDSKQPFIFKHRKAHQQAEAYCGINIYGKFFVEGTKDCIITTDKYVPATKEQRDLLFQKLKEAGYEWNEKEKELKKIKKAKTRPMTYQELAWWLMEKPEEHRECRYKDCKCVFKEFKYNEEDYNCPTDGVLIRKNGGEWKEPLIETNTNNN